MNRRLLSVLIVAVGMIAGGVLVSNKQNINKEASEIGNAGKIIIQPTLSGEEGNVIEKLDISISSGINAEKPIKISSFSLRLKYPGDIVGKIVDASSEPFKKVEERSNDWEFTVNEVKFADGVTMIDLAGVYMGVEGYNTQGAERFAYVEFMQDEFTSEDYSVLGWDEQQTKMMTKHIPIEDIVQSIDKR